MTMSRHDRLMATRLESIMDRHEAREARTLLELNQAGFHLTIPQARDRLAAQRRMPSVPQHVLDEIVAELARARR
ncbi:hypothetical protein ACSBPH_01715 [Microbacterium sp. F51-2R]|uniref:hypothetical protein n=1 Tax=Microbacterium sp. F51-2R TaxID=3445777 RepID=UPI003FA16E54